MVTPMITFSLVLLVASKLYLVVPKKKKITEITVNRRGIAEKC